MRRRPWTVLLLLVALAALSASGALPAPGGGGVRDGGTLDGAGPGAGARAGPSGRVDRVVDGDTVVVDGEGVRLIGVDTPESVAPGQPVECFGPAASRYTERLVEGRRVRLVFDLERRDRFGRLLAYVFRDGAFVNADLVAGGYATTLTLAPNDRFAERFARLEARARREGRGLWGAC